MRFPLRAAGLAALLLVSIAPVGAADHVYSHRFVTEGRVLTEAGLPLANATVEFDSTSPYFVEPCGGQPHQNVTDEYGDFRFCFHIHELDPSDRITLRVGNTTLERGIDTAFRRGIVNLVVEDEAEDVPEDWHETYRFAGKVWRAGSTSLEGVPVYGVAQAHAPVNLTLILPDGIEAHRTVFTDAYGDFDVTYRLPSDVDANETKLVLESFGSKQRRSFETFGHRTTVGFRLPQTDSPIQVNFGQEPSPWPAPGTRTPPFPAALLVALGLGVIGMVHVAKKRREEK